MHTSEPEIKQRIKILVDDWRQDLNQAAARTRNLPVDDPIALRLAGRIDTLVSVISVVENMQFWPEETTGQ